MASVAEKSMKRFSTRPRMGYDSYDGCRLPKDPPSEAYAGSPYGFFRSDPEDHATFLDSAKTLHSFLREQRYQAPGRALSAAIQRIRQALWRVATTDSPDWFTLFRAFGYPSYENSRELVRSLGELKRRLRTADAQGCHQAVERFEVAGGRQALLEFITDIDRIEKPMPLAFILWNHRDDGCLAIGVTDRPLAVLASELRRPGDGQVYGVLGAWRVRRADSRIAQSEIGRRLARYAKPAGGYGVLLPVARREVLRALEECGSEPPQAERYP
jgi:hypothetical protein